MVKPTLKKIFKKGGRKGLLAGEDNDDDYEEDNDNDHDGFDDIGPSAQAAASFDDDFPIASAAVRTGSDDIGGRSGVEGLNVNDQALAAGKRQAVIEGDRIGSSSTGDG